MPKRELSPASRERNARPLQQQKSISDIIGPMVDQCHLDLENRQSLASLASQNAELSQQRDTSSACSANGTEKHNSTGSSRQNSSESEGFNSLDCEQEFNLDGEVLFGQGYTDADGRLGDAAKAVGKASIRVVEAVAEDVQTVLRGTVSVTRLIAEDIQDTVDSSVDLFGTGINVTTGLAKSCIRPQGSLEEKPDNNVYISHPTEGAAYMIPMGMHIQPFSSKKRSGQMVLMVEPGKLAEQAYLKENDVIIAIGEKDVQNVALEEALHIFGTISSTFSMTIVRRMFPIEGLDIPLLVKKTITVEVHINADNVVAVKILEIRCSRLYWMQNEIGPQLIAHKPGSSSNWTYMKVTSDGMLTMDTQETDECRFELNFYSPLCFPVGGNYGVCPNTLKNMSCNKALEIKIQENNIHQVALGDADGLTNEAIDVDLRFFLMHYPWGQNGEMLLESSKEPTKGHFLAVENGQLTLRPNNYTTKDDLRNIDSKFRFKVATDVQSLDS